ncbi:MAG TPA: ribose 5-phosphate isomerase B [Dehalococcoidia bacterium]|nr:ribose 5-phosphate isomerase B [Dehalococcoidia bacterium]
MRIAIGCDHRGLELKKQVIELVEGAGHSYDDLGCYTTESVDYPDIARDVAQVVVKGHADMGILICSTGIGVCIAANKVKGVRAALCCDAFSALRARQHNDANILCLGAGTYKELLDEIITSFLEGVFEEGRHQRRIDKITAMEA